MVDEIPTAQVPVASTVRKRLLLLVFTVTELDLARLATTTAAAAAHLTRFRKLLSQYTLVRESTE